MGYAHSFIYKPEMLSDILRGSSCLSLYFRQNYKFVDKLELWYKRLFLVSLWSVYACLNIDFDRRTITLANGIIQYVYATKHPIRILCSVSMSNADPQAIISAIDAINSLWKFYNFILLIWPLTSYLLKWRTLNC